MFSTCPFVRPSVCYQTYEHDILKTKEPIWLQIGTRGPRGKEQNDQLRMSEGQRSRSHDARVFDGASAEGTRIEVP